jgi:hypothetical protein
MRKLALFVEGQTEQLFVERLIQEIAGAHRVHMTVRQGSGGAKSPRQFVIITDAAPPAAQYYVLINNCGTDNRVLSDIRDQYETMATRGGYHKIVGLRDVYPLDAGTVRARIAPLLPTGPVPTSLHLAIAEIEAWFLAEETHYLRVDPVLTVDKVEGLLGKPVIAIDVEAELHPSDTLKRIYQLAAKTYSKDRSHTQRTIFALDIANLYLAVSLRVPALAHFCQELDAFFAPGTTSTAR